MKANEYLRKMNSYVISSSSLNTSFTEQADVVNNDFPKVLSVNDMNHTIKKTFNKNETNFCDSR